MPLKKKVLKVIGEYSSKACSPITKYIHKREEGCPGNNQNCKSQICKSPQFSIRHSPSIHTLLLLSFTQKSNYVPLSRAFIPKVRWHKSQTRQQNHWILSRWKQTTQFPCRHKFLLVPK